MVHGYFRTSQNRKEKRVTEYSQNYVDRVRFSHLSKENKDQSGNDLKFKQISTSNLDLSISRKNINEHVLYNKIRPSKSFDCNTQSNISDLSLKRNDSYEDLNTIKYTDEIINFFSNKFYSSDDFCSLRRSRSLAIIREEKKAFFEATNDNSPHNKAQLIPRAKLLTKTILNERFIRNNKPVRRPYILINGRNKSPITQILKKTIDNIQSDDYTKQNDKSDLDSLNSEYFKNSSHQGKDCSKVRLYKNQNIHKSKNHHFNKTIQKYQDNSQSSAFPESTTSITDSSSTSSNHSDIESFADQGNEVEDNTQINSNKNKSGVIVYDTVYLSSEESSEDQTILCKPVIISAVEKKFKTFSDYAKVPQKNILSNLSFTNNIDTKSNDNQYFSLPDCEIGQSLNISEKIDNKLRSSYNLNFSIDEKSIKASNNAHFNSKDTENESKLEDDRKLLELEENSDNVTNIRIIVTDEQDEIIEKTSDIKIIDIKKDIKNNSLRKNSIKAKSRGIRRSVVRTQSFKTMSRPQILQIFDTQKRIKQSTNTDDYSKNEFLDKVNSVKKFWSKFSDDSAEEQHIKENKEHIVCEENTIDSVQDLGSFSPAIELVNLSEQKKVITVDSEASNNEAEPMFDHVRYKVLKSNAVRNNIIIRNKKDISYSGLLQYLQEYKFQELLNNNNVVIVEPIRTKVDTKVTNKQKVLTETSLNASDSEKKVNTKKNNVKKHFFYQPIQINREMYEDELPTPDIVRKTKKIFEGVDSSKTTINKYNRLSSSSDNLDLGRRQNFQTNVLSFNTTHQQNAGDGYSNKNKWETLSISSGISSGKHTPPCECIYVDEKFNENSEELVKSNLNLPNCKSANTNDNNTAHYVSEDILEKIRECGSSITYYGGQKSGNASNIIKKFNDFASKDQQRINDRFNNNFLGDGTNFKLLKSNSCSSRLELVGTNYAEDIRSPKSTIVDVKEIIKKMEKTIVVSNNFRPRIIESECIEKKNNAFKKSPSSGASCLHNVTVNNKIIIADQVSKKSTNNFEDQNNTIKVNRNKNVDLAFAMKANPTKKILLDQHSISPISSNTEEDNCHATKFQQDLSISNNLENIKFQNNDNHYGKHYVLNDNRVLKKSYYEIEFEEFEIYDPVKNHK